VTAAATLPVFEQDLLTESQQAVLDAALSGLTRRGQKTLPPWLFYDEAGSTLFEQITALPEYYLTRTERQIFTTHALDILSELGAPVTLAELGAGSAAKTGVLLRAATKLQPEVLYQPIDISPSALDEAAVNISANIQHVRVEPTVANYITETYDIMRPEDHKVLALYIGSSIGNFSPSEALQILTNLRQHLDQGDALLLGVDLAPSEHKTVGTLLAAYDDASGVTAAFNKNILTRLNRELGADFDLDAFAHRAKWNQNCSRIEMHLESLRQQTVHIADQRIAFAKGETIHTENSHKFTDAALEQLLTAANFTPTRHFHSPERSFAVVLATTV
jgi:dimethylhistidine N-methyltransferase